jgi:hypothetical protein
MAGAWFVPVSWELHDRDALVIDYEIPPVDPGNDGCGVRGGGCRSPGADGLAHLAAAKARIFAEVSAGAPYVGICLTNPWGEMIDIDTRQTSLNLAQSQIDNGRVRILLSTQDFGVHNWLDARGYRSGILTWRASTRGQPATPTVTVIDVDQIDEYFDAAHRISGQDRVATMMARHQHFAERNTP